MKSRRDRVVRVRMAPDTTMPEQRSRKVFTWVSMCAVILRDELETSERCLVLMKLTHALILTKALGEYCKLLLIYMSIN